MLSTADVAQTGRSEGIASLPEVGGSLRGLGTRATYSVFGRAGFLPRTREGHSLGRWRPPSHDLAVVL